MDNKQLGLMRHGDSNASPESQGELTDIGRAQVELTARQMVGTGFVPEVIYCAKSLRTRETAEIVKRVLVAYKAAGNEITIPEIIIEDELFSKIVPVVSSIDRKYNRVLIVTHEAPIASDLMKLVPIGVYAKAIQDKVRRNRFPVRNAQAVIVTGAEGVGWRNLLSVQDKNKILPGHNIKPKDLVA